MKEERGGESYQNLSEEEENKKQQYCHEQYKNLPEVEKQRLINYRKKIGNVKK